MRLLKGAGLKVSVDSFSLDELTRGARAGADFLLSLNEQTLDLAFETDAVPVLVPVRPDDLPSLDRAIERMEKAGRPYMADPILEPIHFGFVESITRYHETRRRWPGIEMMMGTGNLTELTEADSLGVTALLVGMCSELADPQRAHRPGLEPHPPHGGGARRRPPGDVRGQAPIPPCPRATAAPCWRSTTSGPIVQTPDEIAAQAAEVKRPELPHRGGRGRRSTSSTATSTRSAPTRWRSSPTSRGPAPWRSDGAHAFYLGGELTKAETAWRLGKRYVQDEPWPGGRPPTPRWRTPPPSRRPGTRSIPARPPPRSRPATPRRPRPGRPRPRRRGRARPRAGDAVSETPPGGRRPHRLRQVRARRDARRTGKA